METVIVESKVYFDTQLKKFRTIRGISSYGYILSEPCKYYRDAQTTMVEGVVSEEYFENNLMEIEDIDTFPYVQKVELAPDYLGYVALPYPTLGKMDLKQLNYYLQITVEEEDYEKAVQIRDEIERRNNIRK